jgi:ABC-2 type transport system ATP-binding protein
VDDEHLDAVATQLATLGLRSLVCTPPSLEQLFLQHYGIHSDGSHSDGSKHDRDQLAVGTR